MHDTHTVGLDIGSHSIKVVVCSQQGKTQPFISGIGTARSKGVTHGFITSVDEVSECIKQALVQAETHAQIPITGVYLALGGIGIEDARLTVEIQLPRNEPITEETLERALALARQKMEPALLNKTRIHEIPIFYTVDGSPVLGSPIGLVGTRMSATILFIAILSKHVSDAIEAVERTGVDVLDTLAAPIASSLVCASQSQKRAGCVIVNIGAETTSSIIYEHGNPQGLCIIPFGSQSVTESIALSVKSSLDEAERLKRNAGSQLVQHRTKVIAAIQKQVKTILGKINEHIVLIGKHRMLPAGIFFTGGGSRISDLTDLGKQTLNLPASIAHIKEQSGSSTDPGLSVAFGAAMFGALQESAEGQKSMNRFMKKIANLLKQLLP
jgi:cell division protein FtsA